VEGPGAAAVAVEPARVVPVSVVAVGVVAAADGVVGVVVVGLIVAAVAVVTAAGELMDVAGDERGDPERACTAMNPMGAAAAGGDMGGDVIVREGGPPADEMLPRTARREARAPGGTGEGEAEGAAVAAVWYARSG